MALTVLEGLINPEVMADMISAKITNKIVVVPIAKVDTTLVGHPGDTITVPAYAYIGDAEDVAEGVEAETVQLTATSATATVKKAMKAVALTDEAVLSGYGNPTGEAIGQLAKAIASKVDVDAMDVLTGDGVQLTYTGDEISYSEIVKAIDVFAEEFNSDKVLFVHPNQVTTLRLDENFISADKYTGDVIMTGEIGKIANCRIVASRKISVNDSGYYACPIVKLNEDSETEDESPALTIYLKRDVNVETERNTLARLTMVSVDQFYTVALSNSSKVVLAYFLAESSTTE